MEYCGKCIMPVASPLVFLTGGVCNFCHEYQAFHYHGEQALLKILEHARKKSDDYDCLVSISGGRDSSFTLLKLAKDYSLRVLAVNYMNPFTDGQAKKNIANAVKALGVKLIQFSLKNNLHERILKNNILAWFGNPSAANDGSKEVIV